MWNVSRNATTGKSLGRKSEGMTPLSLLSHNATADVFAARFFGRSQRCNERGNVRGSSSPHQSKPILCINGLPVYSTRTEYKIMNKRHAFSLIIAGVMMTFPVNRCLAQEDEPKDNHVRQMQILLRTEGLDTVSPELRGKIPEAMKQQMLPPDFKAQRMNSEIRRLVQQQQTQSQQTADTARIREQLSLQIEFLANQGTDVQKLKELVERLQLAFEKSEEGNHGDIEVAVFAVQAEPQEHAEGSPHPIPHALPHGERPLDKHLMSERPGFAPPMLMMQKHMLQLNGPRPQIHRPDMHEPEGRFAEEKKRIDALSESAERLAHAGMPDVAQALRERAGQIKKEVAEKQERIQHEERERAQAQMREQQEHARQQRERNVEQRRESAEHDDRPALPLRELHEQLEQLRREVHSINEKVSHLTEMIEHHHRAQERREPREEMDDEEDDQEDDNTDDDDREVKQDRDRDEDDDDEREDE